MSDKFKILNADIKKLEFSNISSPGWTIKQYNTYPVLDYLGKVYADYAKASVKSEFTIERNSIAFVFKFIMPIVMITIMTYFTIFVPFEFARTEVCFTFCLLYTSDAADEP